MKKFSKLLAVVLAIAVVICPMTSVVSYATANGSYKIEATSANDLELTISSADGFLVYLATVTFDKTSAFDDTYDSNGYVDGMKVISCKFKESGVSANANNTPAITATKSGTSLNILVASTAGAALDLYSEVVIGIHVTESTTASLTKIQAADGGDGQTVESDPTLLAFAGVNSSTGAVDTSSAEYIANGTTNAHEHSFTETSIKETANLKTAATCTADAVYYKTCSVCHVSSNNDSYTFVDTGSMVAHTPSNTKTNKKTDATCTTGTVYYKECSVCHTQLTDTWTDTDAKGHKLTAHAATDSTCTTAGNTLYYTCDNGCGLYFADAAGNTQIEENSWVKVLDSNVHEGTLSTTYSYDADNHWQVYSECGHTANVAAHVYDNACDTTCNVCGAVRSVSPHNYAYDSTGAKTATTHTMKCSVCNDTTTENHNFGAYVSDNNATCGVDGTKTRTCSVCGYQDTVTDTGSALSHSYNYTSNNNGTHNAVCANNASHVITNEACDTAGANGVCSKCGYKAAAVCTHAHVTFISATPTHDTATNGTIRFYCEDCKKTVDETLTYQSTLRLRYPALELKSEILYALSGRQTELSGYDAGFVVSVQEHSYTTTPTTTINDINLDRTVGVKQGTNDTYRFDIKVGSVDMPDTITTELYARKNGVWYSGRQDSNSVRNFVSINFASQSAEMKTLFVDLLNYGAAAQSYFNRGKTDLANKNLTTEQLAYASATVTPAVSIKAGGQRTAALSSSVGVSQHGLTLSSKIPLDYTLHTTNYVNLGKEISDLTAVITYTDGFKKDHQVEYKLTGYQGEDQEEMVFTKTNRYTLTFTDFSPLDMRTAFTLNVYNSDGKVLDTYTYSVASFIADNPTTDAGLQALYDAILKYGDSCKAAFIN